MFFPLTKDHSLSCGCYHNISKLLHSYYTLLLKSGLLLAVREVVSPAADAHTAASTSCIPLDGLLLDSATDIAAGVLSVCVDVGDDKACPSPAAVTGSTSGRVSDELEESAAALVMCDDVISEDDCDDITDVSSDEVTDSGWGGNPNFCNKTGDYKRMF